MEVEEMLEGRDGWVPAFVKGKDHSLHFGCGFTSQPHAHSPNPVHAHRAQGCVIYGFVLPATVIPWCNESTCHTLPCMNLRGSVLRMCMSMHDSASCPQARSFPHCHYHSQSLSQPKVLIDLGAWH